MDRARARRAPAVIDREGRCGPGPESSLMYNTEIEGAADLVVECVSDSSVTKDSRVLLDLYHRARVREYWLIDARPAGAVVAVHQWAAGGYARMSVMVSRDSRCG